MTSYGDSLYVSNLKGVTTLNDQPVNNFINAQTLSEVLTEGNDAAGANIDNVGNLKVINLTNVSTLNGENVNQFLTAQNLADVLTVGNSAGSANIEGVSFYKGSNMTLIGEASAGEFTGNILTINDSLTARFTGCVSTIFMPNLPTSDPLVANQLWRDSGNHVKISAGGGV